MAVSGWGHLRVEEWRFERVGCLETGSLVCLSVIPDGGALWRGQGGVWRCRSRLIIRRGAVRGPIVFDGIALGGLSNRA